MPTSGSTRLSSDQLDELVALAEDYAARATQAIQRSTDALSTVHRSLYPRGEVGSLVDLIDHFLSEPNPLLEVARTQTEKGAEVGFSMLMAHGVQADFEKACSSHPTTTDGKEVALTPFLQRARAAAKMLGELLAQRAIERAAAKARRAAKKAAGGDSTDGEAAT